MTRAESDKQALAPSPFPEEQAALRDTLLASVESVARCVKDATSDSEEARTLSPIAAKALRESDLTAMKSPRCAGGAEAHPHVQMDVIEALTRMYPAAGWSLLITSGITARVLSSLPDASVKEILRTQGFPFVAGSLKPSGRARAVENGFVISGRWSWASGLGHADYVAAPAFLEDRSGAIWAVVPKDQVQVHDTWFSLGLKGTGSADFSLEESFVPTEFTSSSPRSVRGGPLYRLGYGGAAHEHGIFACALAQAALDSLLSTAGEKKRGYVQTRGLVDREVFQSTVAEAELRIRAARLLMADTAARLLASASEHEAPVALQAEARAAATFCTDEAVDVTTKLFRFAGGGAVMQGDPMEQILRDLLTAQAHLFVSDAAYESLGRLRLGLTDQAPLG